MKALGNVWSFQAKADVKGKTNKKFAASADKCSRIGLHGGVRQECAVQFAG
jgi:hypothetical protein